MRDLTDLVRTAEPRTAASAPARERARRAARDGLATAPAHGSRRRAARWSLAVAGLAAAATTAVVVVAMLVAGGGDPTPRVILPGDRDPSAAAPPAPGTVRVPDLVGRGVDEARLLLGDLGLQAVTIVEAPSPLGPPAVTRQDPAAGAEVPAGSAVTLALGPGREGTTAPAFDLPLLHAGADPRRIDGDRVTLDDLRGDVIVLAFTASWCEPCGALAATLQQIQADASATGVAVVAVAARDLRQPAAALASPGTRFALALDGDGAVADAYRAPALPVVVVIDRAGDVALRYEGVPPPRALAESLQPFIAEGRPPGAPRAAAPGATLSP